MQNLKIKLLLLFIILTYFNVNLFSQINYFSFGKGEAIFVIHGGPLFNSTYLIEPFSELSLNYHLIFIDLPGRGASILPEDSICGLNSDVESIEKIRKKMNIDKINLIGHSFGSIVSLAYSKKYSDKINKIVLVSIPIEVNLEIFTQKQNDILTKLSADTIKNKYDNLKLLKKINFHDTNLVNIKYLKAFEKSILNHDTARHFKTLNELYFKNIEKDWDYYFNLPFFSIKYKTFESELKTLIIHGKHDEIAFIEYFDSSLFPKNVKYHLFENSSHNPFYEENKMFIKLIKDFFKQN
jgi:proline iminopeptidase